MWDLRWVLLGLGALLVAGLYFWSKGVFKRRSVGSSLPRADRAEPSIGGIDVALDDGSSPSEPPSERPKKSRAAAERVVTIRLIPRDEELTAETAVRALRGSGLRHGRYGIFHKLTDAGDTVFSVANLTEPGTFDVQNLADSTVAGLSFFVVLPGDTDPVSRFDSMVEVARALAVELEADLHDDGGSSWSVQRERYLREELIEYKHLLERR
jgi:cell division protein ZipA